LRPRDVLRRSHIGCTAFVTAILHESGGTPHAFAGRALRRLNPCGRLLQTNSCARGYRMPRARSPSQ